ncbi:MAG: helix-turn-helix domain-containing protein [Verrucomicrobiota bacterium]
MKSTTKKATAVPEPGNDARRVVLLEAAFGVFARYGYRKTSMDEVARAAQISRQGLYLHFANKEDLFRATLRQAVDSALAAALGALKGEAALTERVLGGFDEWVGRHVGRFGADASDLIEAAETVGGNVIADQEKLFLEAVAAELREAGLAAAYKPAGLTTRQLAENLAATGKGLKHSCATREEFRQAFATAVRITCAPLAGR